MTHTTDRQLALFAGDDLPFWSRWKVARHLRDCSRCQAEVEGYKNASEVFAGNVSQTPKDLHWDLLAQEMTGNIRVGLAAGECVATVFAKPVRPSWRPAMALGVLTIVLSGAWWLNPPASMLRQRVSSAVVLQSTPGGIGVTQGGGALTLMHSRGEERALFVSSPNSLRVRYVDAETGQVTINNVYAH